MENNLALIVSDLHLSFDHVRHRKGKGKGKLYLPVLDKILDELKKTEAKYLFNLGDTFHDKDKVSVTLQEIYRDFLEEVSEMNVSVVQIVGNHDFSLIIEDFVYHALRQYDISSVTMVHDTYKFSDDIGFISYCQDKETYQKRISKLAGCKIIFGHFDINGFALGDDYIEKKTFLNLEDLIDFDLVISGHYHEPQEKDLGDFKVVYVGSAYTTTFGESNQEKRFLLMNLDTKELKDIPTNMTFHKTVKITADEPYPEISEDEINRGVKYKLKVEGTIDQYENFLTKKPKDFSEKVIIEPSFIPEKKERIEIKSSESREDVLEKYIEYKLESLFPEEERKTQDYIDKMNELKEVGLKYLNQGKK